MNKDVKISIAIPTYERREMLLESFAQVLEDDRVETIRIIDDCSSRETFEFICDSTAHMSKVLIMQQSGNVGMGHNKKDTLRICPTDYAILLDSDNIIDSSYIDAIYMMNIWDPKTIFAPVFAKPNFDFRDVSNRVINRKTLKRFKRYKQLNCLLNTCNYFVNVKEYCRVWQPGDKGAADSIRFMYNWFKAGNSLYVNPAMEYFHRVHDGSGFKQNMDDNMKMAAYWEKEIWKL